MLTQKLSSRRAASARRLARKPTLEGRKVSARLDPIAAEHLQVLSDQWNVSITEVLSRALAESAERESAKSQPTAYDILMASGFVGSGSGNAPPDLAGNYKHYVSEAMLAKHNSR